MQPEQPQGMLPQAVPPVPGHPEQPNGVGQSFYTPTNPSPYPTPGPASTPPTPPAANVVSWEASEYVHNAKSSLWLVGFGIIVAAATAIAIWFQAWTFAVLIVVMAVTMGIFAFRPPRTLHYTLTENGVQINDKTFNYTDFRAFGVLQDGAFFTLTLIPVKRFAPALSIYFAQDHGEQIVDIVGAHLPMQQLEPDLIDTIMRRLRF